MLPAGQAGMFTVLNQIRGGKRVQDVIWMETTVAWLHSLTQLGGKEKPPVYQNAEGAVQFSSVLFRRPYETC